jgi:hypothetical protein
MVGDTTFLAGEKENVVIQGVKVLFGHRKAEKSLK